MPEPCCDGFQVINAELATANHTLNCNLFGPAKAVLATVKLKERERAKKPPIVFASFCPFCGKKYDGDT